MIPVMRGVTARTQATQRNVLKLLSSSLSIPRPQYNTQQHFAVLQQIRYSSSNGQDEVSHASPDVYDEVDPLFPSRLPDPSRGLPPDHDRHYHWISVEAEELIAKAYNRHSALPIKETQQGRSFDGHSFPPSLGVADLEALGQSFHYEPKTFSDRVAKISVNWLEKLMHLFFREKYDHHAVTLETLAAVPGIVAAAFRHMRSLRRMKRDHGWINPLQEEAENERMHLLIFMQMTKPTAIERTFVMFAQAAYVTFYGTAYALSPRCAHRMVGYLEEAAHRAYTDYLDAIDNGEIENRPAGKIARRYYRLPDDAKLRDVVLHVRGDECTHRDMNHHLSNRIRDGHIDDSPVFMSDEVEHLKKRQ